MRIFMADKPQHDSELDTFRSILGSLSALSNDYCVALNISLPQEIDLLICSPQSIIVMEVKAWQKAKPLKPSGGSAGTDFFHAVSWEHDELAADPKPNPMKSVRDKTNALTRFLEGQVLQVRLPCFPILIFPNMAEAPEGLVFPDGFGKAFFAKDLSERLAEFIAGIRFANANLTKYPIAANYLLTVADIRDKIVPQSFTECAYRADLFEDPHGASQVANNFQFAGPVTGNRFRGMEAPLGQIRSKLQSHLYISGMRRMGKSSLLKRVEQLRWDGVRPFDKTDLVFLDFFSDITDDDARSVYENILFQLCAKLPINDFSLMGVRHADKDLRINLRQHLRNPIELGFDADIDGTRRLFEHLAVEILKAYRAQHPDRRALLVFDEFSDLLLRCWHPEEADDAHTQAGGGSARIGKRDIRFLAALLKNRAFAETCSMVVIGKPYMLELDRRMRTELFSVMSQVQLEFLKEGETRDLVTSLAKPVAFEDGALEHLYWLTAGHPFYVQLICNVLMSQVADPARPVTEADVTSALKEVVKDDSKFDFQMTDYSLETVDDGDRSLYRLTTSKVLACLSYTLHQASQEDCLEADLAKACLKHMHLEERAVEKVVNGLVDAQVLRPRRTEDGQHFLGYKVPLLHFWASRQGLFEKCKRLA